MTQLFDNVTKTLAAKIAEYTKYTCKTYTKGLEDTKKKATTTINRKPNRSRQ